MFLSPFLRGYQGLYHQVAVLVKVIKKSVILNYKTAKAGQPNVIRLSLPAPSHFPDCAGGDQVFRRRDCSIMALHKILPASSSR